MPGSPKCPTDTGSVGEVFAIAALGLPRKSLNWLAGFCLLFFSVTLFNCANALWTGPDTAERPVPQASRQDKTGVRAYNDRVFARTAHRYFNHHIFGFRGRLEDMVNGRQPPIHLNNGLILGPSK